MTGKYCCSLSQFYAANRTDREQVTGTFACDFLHFTTEIFHLFVWNEALDSTCKTAAMYATASAAAE